MIDHNPELNIEDGVLEALTMGIGATLGKGVRKQYYELKKQLFLNRSFLKFDENLRQFAIDMLALSVFHRIVVLPIDGAEGLWKQMQHFNITSIKMRKNSYNSKDFSRMAVITNRFFNILRKQHIETELLAYESIDRFICLLKQFICEREHEKDMDR